MESKKGPLRLAIVLAVTLWAAGCTTMMGGGDQISAAFCKSFAPIVWSVRDTDATVQQAKAHNAVGVKICGWRPK